MRRKIFNKRAKFDEEVLPHLDAMYRVALRLTKREEDASDLVQEALLKAYKGYRGYESGTNCKAWLMRIMYNTFVSDLRKKSKEVLSFLEEIPAEPEWPTGDDRDPLAAGVVTKALMDLPEEFRSVVVLSDIQDFSYREIAEIIGRPVGTVMSRLHRGRRLLQERLFGLAHEEGTVRGAASLEEYRLKRKKGHEA